MADLTYPLPDDSQSRRLLWLALVLVLCQQAGWASVVINEIHYSPDVKTEPVEFIELHNHGADAVDLSGWRIDRAVDFTFPPGSSLAPGGYLVAGENPGAIEAKWGLSGVFGPWSGRLSNDGEQITLLNEAGAEMDTVDYGAGFPWPTSTDGGGPSMELLNPAFDNDMGGHWRPSGGYGASAPVGLIAEESQWHYRKGTSEASSPAGAWRELSFVEDGSWATGQAPVGYGEPFINTALPDMQTGYTTLFLRKTFNVADPSQVDELSLAALFDDGINVWINGTLVLRNNSPNDNPPYDSVSNSASEDLTYREFALPTPSAYLQAGDNVIAVMLLNAGTTSSDAFFDARLLGTTGNSPTPGAQNSVLTAQAPPALRQVDHSPNQPASGQDVIITVKATGPNGVISVDLDYQLVDPGSYIRLSDATYQTAWTTVSMHDDGLNGDASAGDDTYSVVLPGNLQTHRRLVRYRITATNGSAQSIMAPYSDDEQPNFAYFVYDGAPAWTGSARPGVQPDVTYDAELMNRLPMYFLLADNQDIVDCTFHPGTDRFSGYTGDEYLWEGTLVYDGDVYDHIHFRARGGVHRYRMGKNMWKFAFNTARSFQARDDYGREYGTKWRRLNFSAIIQQGDYLHRGEQGMFESAGFKLFNLAGIEAPNTHFLSFRIIDDSQESTSSQFDGDLWGMYLAIEQLDGRFLDEHNLPDSNIFKMENGTGVGGIGGELNHQASFPAVSDSSDLIEFKTTYEGGAQTEQWWRDNVDLNRYYSYRTILMGIHHYDIAFGKNYFYFHNIDSNKWVVHPWDLDLSWADNMFGNDGEPFRDRVLTKPSLQREYRNRVREIRDLLFNTDQAHPLIDELASFIHTPGQPSWTDIDRAIWDYNPVMTSSYVASNKAGEGRFYESSPTNDFPGMLQIMKDYVVERGALLDSIANDPAIPATPVIQYVGLEGYPANDLRFQTGPFSDPQGAGTFAAMKWRIGEITGEDSPAYDPSDPRRFEIEPLWKNTEISGFSNQIKIPPAGLQAGHTYRVRVKMKDNTGRWSHWSEPVEFVLGAPSDTADYRQNLKVTELMADPPWDRDFEFIELQNTSGGTLDLTGLIFTDGIAFSFPAGVELGAGQFVVLTRTSDIAGFRSFYNVPAGVPVLGPYEGRFDNVGERVELSNLAGGAAILEFEYDNARGWPVAPQGGGHSLVPRPSAIPDQAERSLDYPGNWMPSVFIRGSAGRDEPEMPQTVLLNEFKAHTDFDGPQESNDWVELYNPAGSPVTLNGDWYLSDDQLDLRKYAFTGQVVPAGGFIAVDEISNFHPSPETGFGLSKSGERLVLSHLPGTAADRIVDSLRFEGQVNGRSMGRYADGGEWWYPMLPSRGAANAPPELDVVIHEIMYHPDDNTTASEYIEIHNPTGQAIELWTDDGIDLPWRISGEESFSFPPDTVIAAGEYLLVVGFPPTDLDALNDFRDRFGVADNVRFFGPLSGALSNHLGRISLEKAQAGDPPAPLSDISWIVVDEVIYFDANPFPASPDGFGFALQRESVDHSGMDPSNWSAALPTPGYRARAHTEAGHWLIYE